MRVLHVVKLDPRSPGGIERFAHELMTAQVEAGLEVHAVGCDVAETPSYPAPPYRVALARTWLTVSHLPFAPAFPALVRREIARLAPDVVHVHWPNPLVLDLAPRVPASSRLVLHWQADIDPSAANAAIRLGYALAVRRWEARLVDRADAIIATSEPYASASPALARAAAGVRIVPLGLREPGRAAAAPWPIAGTPRVLFVGRAVPYKGFELLLEALARLPLASLVAIGSGPSLAAWRASAVRLGVDRRVSFVGAVDEDTKRAFLAACDLVVMPSANRLESFGVVQLEAAAAGKPVVVADVPGSGIGAVARALPLGATFPPGDLAALVGAIEKAPSADGTHTLPPEFGIGRIAERIAAIYREA